MGFFVSPAVPFSFTCLETMGAFGFERGFETPSFADRLSPLPPLLEVFGPACLFLIVRVGAIVKVAGTFWRDACWSVGGMVGGGMRLRDEVWGFFSFGDKIRWSLPKVPRRAIPTHRQRRCCGTGGAFGASTVLPEYCFNSVPCC